MNDLTNFQYKSLNWETEQSVVKTLIEPYRTSSKCIDFERSQFTPSQKIKVAHLGEIVAFMGYRGDKDWTVVPGIFNRELGNNQYGLREIEVKTIPARYSRIRERISQTLKENGFSGTINFWNNLY